MLIIGGGDEVMGPVYSDVQVFDLKNQDAKCESVSNFPYGHANVRKFY